MSAIVDALLAELDDQALSELAERLEPYLGTESEQPTWLNAEDAARYMACDRGRIYDLVQLGALAPARDGRRLVFRRTDLDSYLEQSV